MPLFSSIPATSFCSFAVSLVCFIPHVKSKIYRIIHFRSTLGYGLPLSHSRCVCILFQSVAFYSIVNIPSRHLQYNIHFAMIKTDDSKKKAPKNHKNWTKTEKNQHGKKGEPGGSNDIPLDCYESILFHFISPRWWQFHLFNMECLHRDIFFKRKNLGRWWVFVCVCVCVCECFCCRCHWAILSGMSF